MKIVNLILAVLFFLFAVVQLNDDPHDRVFWVILYGGVGIISAFAAWGKYNKWALLLGLAVIIFELFNRFPAFAQWCANGMPSIVEEMSASSPHIEATREYLGLVVSLAVLLFHYIRYARKYKKGQ